MAAQCRTALVSSLHFPTLPAASHPPTVLSLHPIRALPLNWGLARLPVSRHRCLASHPPTALLLCRATPLSPARGAPSRSWPSSPTATPQVRGGCVCVCWVVERAALVAPSALRCWRGDGKRGLQAVRWPAPLPGSRINRLPPRASPPPTLLLLTAAGSGGSQGLWTLTISDVGPNNTLYAWGGGWLWQECRAAVWLALPTSVLLGSSSCCAIAGCSVCPLASLHQLTWGNRPPTDLHPHSLPPD